MTFPGNDLRNNAPTSPFNPPAGPRGGQGPRLPRQGQDNTWQARAGAASRLFGGRAAPRGPRNLDMSLDDIVRDRREGGGNQRGGGGGGGGGWRGGR
jgi:hypothetical protein